MHGGAAAVEGGAEHHGWNADGVARRTTDAESGFHLSGGIADGEHGPGGDGHDRTGSDRKETAEKGAPSVWERDPKSITKDSREFYEDASKNLFYRQPGHIEAAGKLGLGVYDLKKIDHRKLQIS